jgi:hypothetical protein
VAARLRDRWEIHGELLETEAPCPA